MKRTTALLGTALLLATLSCGRGNSNAATDATAPRGRPDSPRTVRTETVVMSTSRRTVDTTGTVAFNQNRSTQVLSPISGPVARIVAGIGSRVRRGAGQDGILRGLPGGAG